MQMFNKNSLSIFEKMKRELEFTNTNAAHNDTVWLLSRSLINT